MAPSEAVLAKEKTFQTVINLRKNLLGSAVAIISTVVFEQTKEVPKQQVQTSQNATTKQSYKRPYLVRSWGCISGEASSTGEQTAGRGDLNFDGAVLALGVVRKVPRCAEGRCCTSSGCRRRAHFAAPEENSGWT